MDLDVGWVLGRGKLVGRGVIGDRLPLEEIKRSIEIEK